MNAAPSCPSVEDLRQLLLGQLPDGQAEAVEQHFAGCAGCARTVLTIAAEDTVVDATRTALPDAEPQDVALVAELMARFKQVRPLAYRAEAEPTQELFDFLAPPEGPGELGRLGPYRVLEVLGSGGMGVVFRAEDPELQRPVALKALRPSLAASAEAKRRFLREAKATARLRDDHIVTIYHVGEDRGCPFLAMECLEGETLETRVRRRGRLPVGEALGLVRDIAEGLAAAHAAGLIHRDVKPANVWLESRPGGVRAKLLDFGLARAVAGDSRLTHTGQILGTPSYMAPEQSAGRPVDARGDLFSLGCVLYRLCAGAVPFPGADALATLAAVALKPPPRLDHVNADVPRSLADLVLRLLAKDPADRPASARAVVDALTACECDLEARATPAAGAPRPRWHGAAWTTAAFLAGMLLMAAVLTVRTRDGTLVVHVLEPDVQVTVDEHQQVTIDSAKVGKVQLIPGTHQLTVKRGNEELLTTAFTLRSGGEAVIVATWERRPAPPPADPAPGPARAAAAPDDAWVRFVSALRPELQVEVVKDELKRRNAGFDGEGWQAVIENGVVIHLCFTSDTVTDLAPVRALTGLTMLVCHGVKQGRIADLAPLKGLPLQALLCDNNQIKDLRPVRELPSLRLLHCQHNPVADLAPLKGLQLHELLCNSTQVCDLSPLQEMPLEKLQCEHTQVRELLPLKDLKLKVLSCHQWGTRRCPHGPGLAPLQAMPLVHLDCDLIPERDAELLRAIKTLETINDQPAAELWKKLDAERAAFVQWSTAVRQLPAEGQWPAVADRLKECNPGFDRAGTPVVRDAKVVGLRLAADDLADLSPLRALAHLQVLRCAGSAPGKGKLASLWPLQGLPLTELDVDDNPGLVNLAPLARMPLTRIRCQGTKVDLAGSAAVLKEMATLQTINGKPATEVFRALAPTP